MGRLYSLVDFFRVVWYTLGIKNLRKNINMKKIFSGMLIFGAMFVLSGCSFSDPLGSLTATSNPTSNATVLKTMDGGTTWQVKNKIDDKKTIAGVNVLTMAIHPSDPNIIYLGTEANAVFMSKNGGESWSQVAFAEKVYNILFNPQDPNVMYATGIFNGRAKIFKRLKEGEEWKEVYTEPADGTTISSLAIDRKNPAVLYAGTSDGVIIKTTDAGATWVNLKKAIGPIVAIGFDVANSSVVYFGIFQNGVMQTKNAGAEIEDITRKIDATGRATTLYTLVTDPYLAGVAYVGTSSGIFRGSNNGEAWAALNIIESSKAFPIRSIAINPKKSSELIYSSAKAIYKSLDGGVKWSTTQLDTSREISTLKYDPVDSSKIYAGFRAF